MGLAVRDTSHHTYGDYLTWSEDVRYELIDGVAYLMSPAPTPRHQNIAGEIFRQLANALLEWLGDDFDPKAFNQDPINAALGKLKP